MITWDKRLLKLATLPTTEGTVRVNNSTRITFSKLDNPIRHRRKKYAAIIFFETFSTVSLNQRKLKQETQDTHRYVARSVADPGYLSRIPDPGLTRSQIRISIKEFKYFKYFFTQKNLY
jgi:hypothetical protein